MNRLLVIYDETGYILSTQLWNEFSREPVGIPFIFAEIPKGQRLKITDGVGVDVTKTPHEPIFEEIPKTEVETDLDLMKVQVAQSDEILMALLETMYL